MRQNTKCRLGIGLFVFLHIYHFNVMQANLGSALLEVGRPHFREAMPLFWGAQNKNKEVFLKKFFGANCTSYI